MSCRSGRDYDASEYANTWTYVDKSLFGSKKSKLRSAGRSVSRSNDSTSSPIYIPYAEFLRIQANANDPVDPAPIQKEKPQHKAPIKRFQNKKPTVENEYNKRLRQAQAGGGAHARAYAMRQEELDEVKTLKTQLRAMEVKAVLDKQTAHKEEIADALKRRELEFERQAHENYERQVQRDLEKAAEYRSRCLAHQESLQEQRNRTVKMKILDQERKEQENKLVRMQMEKAEQQEQAKLKAAQEAQRKNSEALKAANIRANVYRSREAEEQRQEDLAIAQYNQQKEREARKVQEEREALATVREKEIARLRLLQEKSIDKRAEEGQKKARAYQEQLIERRDKREAAQKAEKQRMSQQVMAERAMQIEREQIAREAQAEEERIEAAARRKAHADALRKERQTLQTYKAKQADHWASVDELKEARTQDRANQQQEIFKNDQKFAMNKAIYDRAVAVAYEQKMEDHKGKGFSVPKHFRPGAAEARAALAAKNQKAQKTRAFW